MKNGKKLMVLALTALGVLASCGGGADKGDTRVADIIAEAEKMDEADLYKKAREEINGKTFSVVANSSRMKDAAPAWRAEMQKIDASFNFDFTSTQPKNNQIFTMIESDVKGSKHDISMTLIQDGVQIKNKMLNTGYLLNYIPKEWDGNKEKDGEPLALQSLNKVFCYNTNGTDGTLNGNANLYKNCWDFAIKTKTQFMAPSSEPVGQNFLYMLTNPTYAKVVKEAYDVLDADSKKKVDDAIASKDAGIGSVFDAGKEAGIFDDNSKYSLAWVYLFQKSYQRETDDGPISQNLTKKESGGAAGLLVYSKFRSTNETEGVSNRWIQVAAYQDGFKGFGGYMYKHYLQILRTSPFPWTSCALIQYMVTHADGFRPWGKDMGGYSSSPKVQSAFDHSKDGDNDTVPNQVKNDRGYDWWTGIGDGKGNLVVEDGVYAAKAASVMAEWINYL